MALGTFRWRFNYNIVIFVFCILQHFIWCLAMILFIINRFPPMMVFPKLIFRLTLMKVFSLKSLHVIASFFACPCSKLLLLSPVRSPCLRLPSSLILHCRGTWNITINRIPFNYNKVFAYLFGVWHITDRIIIYGSSINTTSVFQWSFIKMTSLS